MNEALSTGVQFRESSIHGIYVESAIPALKNKKTHPIVFIHGGGHGSWCFKHFQDFFAESGWESHAPNFLNHSRSSSLPDDRFIARGAADYKEEILTVASTLDLPPVLIAHGLGGIVAQKFAEENPVGALVLLAPVVPVETGVKPFNFPVDLSVPRPVPTFEDARNMFFDGLNDEQARGYYSLLCPESPRWVFEAVNFCVSVDYKKISCPILTFGAENDPLVPPDYVKAFADLTGADFHLLRGRGHNLLLEPGWRETAILIRDWLEARHM